MKNIFAKKKAEVEKMFFIPFECPVFNDQDKAFLQRTKLTEPMKKTRNWLYHQLIVRFLNTNKCNEDFKKGWLACMHAMDNMPIKPEEQDIDEEFTSIQGVEPTDA